MEKPTIPMDYKWAKDLGLVRKPSEFVSTICDDRKEVMHDAFMPTRFVAGRGMGASPY